jgi:hypothetical protein
MKNKEDASKAKSEEYLAFEALAKRIITNNKKDIKETGKSRSNRKPKVTPSKTSKQ